MKGRVWLVVSGAALVLVLDTLRGRQRREKVLEWIAPVWRRRSGGTNATQESAPRAGEEPGDEGPLRAATNAVQEGVGNAAASVSANLADLPLPGAQPAPRPQETVAAEEEGQPEVSVSGERAAAPAAEGQQEGGSQPPTPEELAPRPVPDPIPIHEPTDPTLVARVESELFRDPDLPKGAVSIDAANGVVTLRGTVDEKMATDLIERTGAIEGVEQVVDLLRRG